MVGVGGAVGETATDASEDIGGIDLEEVLEVIYMIPGLYRPINRVRHSCLHEQGRAGRVWHVRNFRFKGLLLQRNSALGVPEGPIPVEARLLHHMHNLPKRINEGSILWLHMEEAATEW